MIAMSEEQKVSAMMIDVAGDLLKTPESQEIKSFIKKQKKYAPSKDALKGLAWEIRRVIKQKDKLYPAVNNKIILAEAIETGVDDYIIRAYFAGMKTA
jgi:hypothetical protein